MNILILNGSPHARGTSALLIDEFTRGAGEAGHLVTVLTCSRSDIHPCIACMKCGRGSAPCVYQDDMNIVNEELRRADLVIFSTPLYYFGMSAQLKAVIDRLFGRNEFWRASRKQAMLFATCGDADDRVMDALKLHYKLLCRYLGWEDAGTLLAFDCYTREQLEASDYPARAYEIGRNL